MSFSFFIMLIGVFGLSFNTAYLIRMISEDEPIGFELIVTTIIFIILTLTSLINIIF